MGALFQSKGEAIKKYQEQFKTHMYGFFREYLYQIEGFKTEM
jgi:hypothetical protein